MKKYLLALGLLFAISQPSFAQCCPNNMGNPCQPRVQVMQVPIAQPLAPAPVYTGAACPVAAPCSVSQMSSDCNYCNPCEKKGFWANFFGF